MVSSVTVTPSVLSAGGAPVVFTTSPAVVDVVDEGGVVVLGSLLPPVVVQADAARVRATATITTERKGCRLALMAYPPFLRSSPGKASCACPSRTDMRRLPWGRALETRRLQGCRPARTGPSARCRVSDRTSPRPV